MKSKIAILVMLTFIFLGWQCTSDKSHNETEGKSMLDSLKNECDKYNNGSPELLEIALKLKDEAFKQDNDRYKGAAYVYLLNYYQVFYNGENKLDTIRHYGGLAQEYMEKADRPKIALWIEADLLRWEMNYGNPESNLDRILKLIKKAELLNDTIARSEGYSVLGEAYYLSNSPQEARKAYEKELQVIRSMGGHKDPKAILPYYLSVFSELGQNAVLMRNYDLALAYTDSTRLYIKKYPELINTSRWKISSDASTMLILSKKGRMKEASEFAKELDSICRDMEQGEDELPEVYYSIQSQFAYYYMKKGEKQKALDIINKAIDYYTNINNQEIGLVTTKGIKSEILASSGKFEKAYDIKSDLLLYKDSVSQANATRQVSEMYTLYQVNELEKQAEESAEKVRYSRTIIFFLLAVSALLLLIAILVKRNSDKLKKKNKMLFSQYQDIDKYRKQLLNINLHKEESDNNDVLPKEPTLFEKTESYMNDSQCYREPDISRESLALQIGTNRQYLTQAIQENVGMTFNEYINYHRLEYARHLLIENTSLSIENIYTSAGFNNKSTFYRLFKQKYDLTPKELRDLALEQVTE